jgi:MFS family permease
MAENVSTSSWTALRNRAFRNIWIASLISGTCASAHGMAATWAVNELSHSTLLLSLLSTFSSLPFFLCTLPAGALADMMSRANIVRITHFWLAASAAGLAILGWLHLLNGHLVLLFVFVIGVGFAFNAPAFSSLLIDIVAKEEIPSATVLSGLQLDLSGMVGPALGGALIPLIGTNAIFAANSACFLLINLALRGWHEPKEQSHAAMENLFQSFATAVRYVRFAPGMQVILARNILFSVFVAAIPALLPVISLKDLRVSATDLGLLYAFMGVGSVTTAAFILPWGRAKYPPDTLTKRAAYLLVLVMLSMAFVRQTQALLVVAALAGVAWTSTANELWLAGQRAMPGWARGRMSATIMMFSQGAMALGGVIYGTAAQKFGVTQVLVIVAGLILVLLLIFQFFSFPLSIDFTQRLSLEPGGIIPLSQNLTYVPQPRDGPVLITIDVQLDETRGSELDGFINELRLIHLRNGAYSWQIFADPSRPSYFHVEILMPSWSQYLLQCERITKAEKEVIDRALSLLKKPPEVRMYVRLNKPFASTETGN